MAVIPAALDRSAAWEAAGLCLSVASPAGAATFSALGPVIAPLVSVITPTWQRHDLLTGRCIPSVMAQTYIPVEHVIVSDGPDHRLRSTIANSVWGHRDSRSAARIKFEELPEHDRDAHWGHWARLRGIEVAAGDLIAYLDDDDAYRPHHVALLAQALTANPGAQWAYSRMARYMPAVETVTGTDPPGCGTIGTPMIMHRRGLLDVATWETASPIEDWELVSRWLAAGAPYVSIPDVTVDVWPSLYFS
jgi:Glycosyl transferase family 2